MKSLLIVILLIGFAHGLRAQIQSPAFDPDCYQPAVGVRGEIDTIYGNQNGQQLGSSILRIDSTEGHPYGQICIAGLPESPVFLSAYEAGPSFDLHHLQLNKKLNFVPKGRIVHRGHFHNSHLIDLLVYDGGFYTIYWSDQQGYYDSVRLTLLENSKDNHHLAEFEILNAYSTYLTSDSVEDIVGGVIAALSDTGDFRYYLTLYRGGESLFSKGAKAFEDSSLDLTKYINEKPINTHIGYQGDWRGTGRNDLIVIDRQANAFYYRNDPPFSLDHFVKSIITDTLIAKWQNPRLSINADPLLSLFGEFLSMQALPKANNDQSQDFLIPLNIQDSGKGSIWVFRGGPDFGSRRLYIDSPSYLIRPPWYYDSGFQGMSYFYDLVDAGDMTGTGNRVFSVQAQADAGRSSMFFFYVMGKALDDKVDMYFLHTPFGAGVIDTLTADNDKLEDVIFGSPHYYSQSDFDKGWTDVGSVSLVHGSKKIPVHLNPKWSVATEKPAALGSMSVAPNPARNFTNVTLTTTDRGPVKFFLRDLLGRVVYSETSDSHGGAEIYRLELPPLPSGLYVLESAGAKQTLNTHLTIVR